MYTPEERERLRSDLIAAARADARLTGAAITGSAAAGLEDEWSDIDLAFGVGDASALRDVLEAWTSRMYERHEALHHVDVPSGAWIYRVFLLRNTLQVDLAFAPAEDFGARAPTFRLLFGAAAERPYAPSPAPAELVGLAWLYALHARSSIARGRLWQAEFMVSAVRDHVLALASVRHRLPAAYARGADRLPAAVTEPLAGALVRRLDVEELRRAFGVALEALRAEVRHVDPELARRIDAVLVELTATPARPIA
ncbi:MAG TPA: nucleotidyltransferase domain-containing protein [Candidatus Dormibacteraeota bacterium]|nr:nucleotidyltransferase domain-containing protein [Candidatus Dormibacteraeota bacterium]